MNNLLFGRHDLKTGCVFCSEWVAQVPDPIGAGDIDISKNFPYPTQADVAKGKVIFFDSSNNSTPQIYRFNNPIIPTNHWSYGLINTSDRQYSRVSNVSDLRFGSGAWAISVWFYKMGDFPTATWGEIISKRNVAPQSEWGLYVNSSDNLNFWLYLSDGSGNSLRRSYGTINRNQWYHLVISYDGVTITDYLGASLVSPTITPPVSGTWTGFQNSSYDVWFGRRSTQSPSSSESQFNGLIGQTAFWKGRGLNKGLVTRLNNGGNGLPFDLW